MLTRAYERARVLVERNRRARRLGFAFGRAATFQMPDAIAVGGARIALDLPHDDGTRTAFVEVLLDDCYATEALSADVRTVADIGAHVGLFALLARVRWPDAVIHAYEPNRALKRYWSGHAAGGRFTVYEEAVGAAAGRAKLVAGCDSVHTRTIEHADGEVTQIALADVVARLGGAADLVKLDCEGAEWPLLGEASPWRNVGALTMEFHLWAGYALDELLGRVRALGFRPQRVRLAGPDFGVLTARR